mmetsp:Transcript_47522/g.136200  ORF Transcript_47522/g.136200 Transcript_47522/m.136200 type:complete len:288 (-) Transcript_47522:250-1113(-)
MGQRHLPVSPLDRHVLQRTQALALVGRLRELAWGGRHHRTRPRHRRDREHGGGTHGADAGLGPGSDREGAIVSHRLCVRCHRRCLRVRQLEGVVAVSEQGTGLHQAVPRGERLDFGELDECEVALLAALGHGGGAGRWRSGFRCTRNLRLVVVPGWRDAEPIDVQVRDDISRGCSQCVGVLLHGRHAAQVVPAEHHIGVEREVLDVDLRHQPRLCRGPRVRDRVCPAGPRRPLPGAKGWLGQGQSDHRPASRVRTRPLRVRRFNRHGCVHANIGAAILRHLQLRAGR